jgi:hypothetical protein
LKAASSYAATLARCSIVLRVRAQQVAG